MCIIAIQPKGKKISKEYMRNMWDNNNDGAGIMYSHNGEVVVKKELHSFKKFMEYKKVADSLNVNIVLHFRISTSAGINIENVHPFKVNDDLYFCHNGILNIDVPVNSKINDTQIFCNTILKNLPFNFLRNAGIKSLISEAIGNRNKFVFLDSLGNYTIINEYLGEWNEGIWYSNSTYSYGYKSDSFYTKKSKGSKYSYSKYSDYGIDYNNWESDVWNANTYNSTTPVFTNIHSQLHECESCGNLTDIQSINYSSYWNAYLCKECNDLIKE